MSTDGNRLVEADGVPPLLDRKDIIEAIVYMMIMGVMVGFGTDVPAIFLAIGGVAMLIPYLGLVVLGNLYRRRKWFKEHR